MCPDTRHALPLGRAIVRYIHTTHALLPAKDIAKVVHSRTTAIRRIIANCYNGKEDTIEEDEEYYSMEPELMEEMTKWVKKYGKTKSEYDRTRAASRKKKVHIDADDDEEDEEDDDSDSSETESPPATPKKHRTTKGSSHKNKFVATQSEAPDSDEEYQDESDAQISDSDSTSDDGSDDMPMVKSEPGPSPRSALRAVCFSSTSKKRRFEESDEDEHGDDDQSDESAADDGDNEEEEDNRLSIKRSPKKRIKRSPSSGPSSDEETTPTTRNHNQKRYPSRHPKPDPISLEQRERIYTFFTRLGYVPPKLDALIESGLGTAECNSFKHQDASEIKDLLINGTGGALGEFQASFIASVIINGDKTAWRALK
ncbi:hypothetical protein D9613_011885 [Agrocybe pediades]|uniref:Uncharacterized protein n=1 Tax=Agrocybe pediades TaxID=84607 RepID=A0A8H4VK06_9AGAR|nr:hypothetical protein D9613_011885 [Agrocybe pediades]